MTWSLFEVVQMSEDIDPCQREKSAGEIYLETLKRYDKNNYP